MHLENILKITKNLGRKVLLFGGLNFYSLFLNAQIIKDWEKQHLEILMKNKNLTKEELEKDSLFKIQSLGIKNALLQDSVRVYILSNKDYRDPDGAHAHTHYQNKEETSIDLCLPDYYKEMPEMFTHESAHVKHFLLDINKSSFTKRWKEIFKEDYRDSKKESITHWEAYPYIMHLKHHPSEDVANFYVAAIQTWQKINAPIKNEKDSLLVMYKLVNREMIINCPLCFADPSDKKFQQKLDLFKEYEFITEKQHEILSKKLGSLYDSVKK